MTSSVLWSRRGEAYGSDAQRGHLRRALLEAALWCHPRAALADPKACLRSPSLAPYIFNDSRHDTVRDVVAARHSELQLALALPQLGDRSEPLVDLVRAGLAEAAELVREGRILVWQRDDTIDDGVGEFETAGYLDESDMPPWDTWVAYADSEVGSGYLVCWVPPAFVPSVSKAVRLNAYDALYWLEDSSLPLSKFFREDGLLA